ncbi:hypothetical protein H6P81_012584 [Aristolochia fimbriata]|uniref:Protein kinase domain-containing protein n=1 Tax=Aristolochia fimbriata TaxID=158543 RepID=A0AAV7EF20_ARIFI|nr:hypothetical protein H6P81_012584 [Aristolochia fimbriata]
MTIYHLNRLCFILPADLDEIIVIDGDDHHRHHDPAAAVLVPPPPNRRRSRSSRDTAVNTSKRAKRLRRWIAAFLRRFAHWTCRYPRPILETAETTRLRRYYNESSFKDMEGVPLSGPILAKPLVGRHNPRIFTYSELYIGSNGFSDDQLLGTGGFGRVYRALLPSDNTLVAVKRVLNNADNSKGNAAVEKTFLAELAAVAQLRHRNLVRLRGWCFHQDQLLLVYDYMPNRSLDRLLFPAAPNNINNTPTTTPPTLSWEQRKKIVSGLAAALFYLHDQLDTQIIHRDVKTSNVMLDSDFNARLGDFGLARWLHHHRRLISHDEYDHKFPISKPPVPDEIPQVGQLADHFRLTQTSRIGGTIGYLPPESFNPRFGSSTSAKSDVFSFGIVVLEVISGRRAVDLSYPNHQIVLLDWVRRLSDEGKSLEAGDARLFKNDDEEGGNSSSSTALLISDMKHLLHLALLCTLHNPQSRPSMRWVMQILSSSDDQESVPPGPPRLVGRNNIICVSVDTHAPREIPYSEIVAATGNFSESQIVAEMEFGTAYRAVLKNGLRVLVKRLGMKTCPALRARFTDELRNLGSLRHRNLVHLRGWCTQQGEMLVVYDYSSSHRSLAHHLLSYNQRPLNWSHRMNIVKSLASAILYLHEEWEEQVIHRCITSSSVFLDDHDMNPRLGSFALAEFLTRNADAHHVSAASSPSSARGIFGYMSPEYMESGVATTTADVYSFGVVVLEVVTGQKAVDFRRPQVLLVQKVHQFETQKKRPLIQLLDSRIPEKLDDEHEHDALVRLLELGLACTRTDPNVRPTMRQIVSVLDGKNDCLHRTKPQSLKEEKREDWEQRNAASLALINRIQALGID